MGPPAQPFPVPRSEQLLLIQQLGSQSSFLQALKTGGLQPSGGAPMKTGGPEVVRMMRRVRAYHSEWVFPTISKQTYNGDYSIRTE